VKFPAVCAISLVELRSEAHFSHPFLIGFSWKIESTTKLNALTYLHIAKPGQLIRDWDFLEPV
jgi:hypothetical protein